jgi:hypothetical protein
MTKMHPRFRLATARWLPVVACAAVIGVADAALTEGRTADGRRYIAGGIGIEEVDAMRGEAPAFSLQVITAARGGAYLANTHVRILGAGNQAVLDTVIAAPWLLVDLPAGRYTLIATHDGRTQERRLAIEPGRPQRLVLHFDAAVDGEGPTDAARSRMPQ